MKSGPVLARKNVKYYEPEYWKFGEDGNKYFRHATGQIYAISKDLATYISNNQPILHKYANEDVSLGAWLFGLEVEQIDDRSLCCGTPPVGLMDESTKLSLLGVWMTLFVVFAGRKFTQPIKSGQKGEMCIKDNSRFSG
ncbi:Beta-1,3-galactosyltransferase 5 [Castilleja foliolosa]|uniref:Hexosyltransferase n=1 Tax=Castilleja foliolosa TaxID=1961234 RepID=A0ABD3BWC4_9LAMI